MHVEQDLVGGEAVHAFGMLVSPVEADAGIRRRHHELLHRDFRVHGVRAKRKTKGQDCNRPAELGVHGSPPPLSAFLKEDLGPDYSPVEPSIDSGFGRLEDMARKDMVQVALLKWEEAEPIAAPIRFAIFVEQRQAGGIELDALDKDSVHAVAYDDKHKAIGTARLLPSGQVGRMAVVKEWRRRGVGAALLEALTEEARKRGYKSLAISAPLQAPSSIAARASSRKAR